MVQCFSKKGRGYDAWYGRSVMLFFFFLFKFRLRMPSASSPALSRVPSPNARTCCVVAGGGGGGSGARQRGGMNPVGMIGRCPTVDIVMNGIKEKGRQE